MLYNNRLHYHIHYVMIYFEIIRHIIINDNLLNLK